MPVPKSIGDKIGRLTFVAFAPPGKRGAVRRRYRCDCGNEKVLSDCHMRGDGGRQSCGCLQLDAIKPYAFPRTHGESESRLYAVWRTMKARCHDSNNGTFRYYGARGIAVCERWRESFEAFASDVGERPTPRHSLDRIDVNGNYEPGNCRWATHEEQARNRSTNHRLTFRGETKPIAAWAEEFGISANTLAMRLRSGWDVERAITTPVRGRLGGVQKLSDLAPHDAGRLEVELLNQINALSRA